MTFEYFSKPDQELTRSIKKLEKTPIAVSPTLKALKRHGKEITSLHLASRSVKDPDRRKQLGDLRNRLFNKVISTTESKSLESFLESVSKFVKLENANTARAYERGLRSSKDDIHRDNFSDTSANAHITAYNKENPEDPITSSTALGSGLYGTVYPGKQGRVVKIASGGNETKLLDNLPKRISKHPIMPREIKTSKVYKKVNHSPFAISKEDLKDMDGIDDEDSNKITKRIDALDYRMDDITSNHDWHSYSDNPEKIAHSVDKTRRMAHFTGLHDWHKENQKSEDLTPAQKESLRKLASGYARYLHYGVIPGDLHNQNIGKRSDGSTAIRDSGIYNILKTRKGDKARIRQGRKFLERKAIRPGQVSKLKSLKNR